MTIGNLINIVELGVTGLSAFSGIVVCALMVSKPLAKIFGQAMLEKNYQSVVQFRDRFEREYGQKFPTIILICHIALDKLCCQFNVKLPD